MALRCESCGAENPATNRYCGQCGSQLEQSVKDSSEEIAWHSDGDLVEHPEISADLPPEVIDFDNQIPLFAGEGSDRRLHPAPEILEQIHDHLGREATLHDQFLHGSEQHHEVGAKLEGRDDFLQWEVHPKGDAADDSASSAPTDPVATQSVANRHFLPEGEKQPRTGVRGLSFLGLNEDSSESSLEDTDEEPESKSHLRRNVGLVIVVAVAVLAAVLWRSIGGHGLPATSKAASEQTVESSPNALGAQQATSTAQPAVPAALAPKTQTKRTPAANARATGVPKHVVPKSLPSRHSSPRDESKASTGRSTAKAREVRAAPLSLAAPVPGADEMKRAVSASDAEARAAWLWKAVGKGNPQASVELAKMYEQGTGVVRSCDQAKVLLRGAAAKGNAQARTNLEQIRIRGGC